MVKEELIDWSLYACGANGQIWSYYWKRMLKGTINKYGYVQVRLKCVDGKKRLFLWHRVIYTYFYGTIPEGYQINHISELKTDNRLCNLNIMTCKENNNYGTRTERAAAKRSKPVVAVDEDGNVILEFASTHEAERKGFNHWAISACCRGLRRTHKGLRWYYLEDYLKIKGVA